MASSSAHSKGKLRRSLTKKSHSWWWDSHISPKNSRWLAQNLEKMDDRVSRMLKLIEEDADSFAQKAQMYYQKRPELVQLVEEFYRMYRALAERYDNVTGELRNNIPSKLVPEGSNQSQGCLEVPPPVSTTTTPQRLSRPHSATDAGHSPDSIHKEEDVTSSLTDSDFDSDSDSASGYVSDRSPGKEALTRRIDELELELCEAKLKLLWQQQVSADGLYGGGFNGGSVADLHGKLKIYEEEICKLKKENKRFKVSEMIYGSRKSLEEEQRIAKEKVLQFEEETSRLKHEFEMSKAESSKLQSIQNKLDAEKREVSKLQERISMLKTSIQDKDKEIMTLKTDVSDAEQKIFPEKAQIKAEMSKLVEENSILGEQVKEMESRARSTEDEKRRIKKEKAEMEERLRGEIEKLNSEVVERNIIIEKLTEDIKGIREERDGVTMEAGRLREEIGEREKKIEEMGKHVEEVKKEQVRLRGREKELEEEAERKRLRGSIGDG